MRATEAKAMPCYRCALLLLSILAAQLAAVPTQVTLGVPLKMQDSTNTCWAAVSQSVLEYFACFVSQTSIVNYATGGQDVGNACPSQDGHYGIHDILLHFAGSAADNTCLGTAYSESLLKEDLYDDRPVGVLWLYQCAMGGHTLYHWMVVYGYDGDNIHFRDPDRGDRMLSYSAFVSGPETFRCPEHWLYSHTWHESFGMLHPHLNPLNFNTTQSAMCNILALLYGVVLCP